VRSSESGVGGFFVIPHSEFRTPHSN
jgi:hypothetical protein